MRTQRLRSPIRRKFEAEIYKTWPGNKPDKKRFLRILNTENWHKTGKTSNKHNKQNEHLTNHETKKPNNQQTTKPRISYPSTYRPPPLHQPPPGGHEWSSFCCLHFLLIDGIKQLINSIEWFYRCHHEDQQQKLKPLQQVWVSSPADRPLWWEACWTSVCWGTFHR